MGGQRGGGHKAAEFMKTVGLLGGRETTAILFCLPFPFLSISNKNPESMAKKEKKEK